jgi:ABC-type transport system involved in cytochrome bd biosynthesis fused ATPase/permease subunit
LEARPLHLLSISQGKLLSRILHDVEYVQDKWIRVWIPWTSSLIAGVAGSGIIFWLHPIAGLTTLTLLIIAIFLVPRLATLSAREESGSIADSEVKLAEHVTAAISGHMEARMFGYAHKFSEDLKATEEELSKHERKALKVSGIASSVVYFIMGLSILINALLAIRAFEAGELAGVNIAILTLLPLAIFDSIVTLPSSFAYKPKMDRSEDFLNQVLGEEERAVGTKRPQELSITFKHARAQWSEDSLRHAPINLEISPKNWVNVEGESGIGKSSLALALLGLIPYEGSITIGGEEVRDIDPSFISENFTVSLQGDHIFASSVRENLRIGNQEATDDHMREILEGVGLTELSRDLDALLGSFGKNLSGGEQQRLKIARALLRETPVYIFDEPTEFLDSDNQQLIEELLLEKLAEKTIIVIQHVTQFTREDSVKLVLEPEPFQLLAPIKTI